MQSTRSSCLRLKACSKFGTRLLLSATHSACQAQYLPGNQRKTLGWWWPYQEPIPKHPLTLLTSPEPLILLPGPVPWGKQRKTLCWWWPYQEPIPNHSLTLLPSPGPSILLPGPIPEKTLCWWWPHQEPQALSQADASPNASHLSTRPTSWESTKGNIGLVANLPKAYCLSVASTLSGCCQPHNLSPCCQVQYLRENKGKHCAGGGPTKNLLTYQ